MQITEFGERMGESTALQAEGSGKIYLLEDVVLGRVGEEGWGSKWQVLEAEETM